MKLSSILVLASFVAQQTLVSARPYSERANHGHIVARQQNNFRNGGNRNGGNRFGGFGGNRNGGNRNGGGNNNNRSSSTAAAATSTSAAAAATSSAANNGGNQNNNNNGGNGGNQNGGNNGGNQGGNDNDDDGGNQGGNDNGGNQGGNEDPQTSLQVDPSVIGPNLAQDGLAAGDPGQVASLTSTNNFVNFCIGQRITNGEQVQGGSCNPVPMGQIPSRDRQPSCKFVFPPNGATIQAGQEFTIQLAVRNLVTGRFTNPQTNYFAAPQQLQGGTILAHSHVVIERLPSLDSTQVTDPTVFEFFKGLNAQDQNGILTAVVTGGLTAGTFKVSSINTAANHQPVLGPVAQHGSFDDVSYFTVE